jgi:hypothetical protein
MLSACEMEDQTSIVMLGGGSSSSSGTNMTYNITNNITNNITTNNYFNQSYVNSSVACSDANNYLWNVTQKDGVLSGLCAADSEGSGTDTNDTVRVNALYNQNTTNYGYFYDIFSANTALTNLGLRIDNLNQTKANQTDWTTQNTSTWLAINARTLYPGISNFTLAQFQVQNTSDWQTIGQKMDLANFTIQNTSIWTAIRSTGTSNLTIAQLPNTHTHNASNITASQSKVCSGTDKVTNISIGGSNEVSITCGTDQTGAGGASAWSNNATTVNTSLEVRTPNHFYQHDVPVLDLNSWFCDFLVSFNAAACYPYFSGTALGTGGTSAVTPAQNNTVGLYSMSLGTGTFSGYLWATNSQAFNTDGQERFSTLYNTSTLAGPNNVSVSMLGFFDTQSNASATTANGIWFNVTVNQTLGYATAFGHVRANSGTQSNTANTVNLRLGDYYIYIIDVLNKTQVNFTIWHFQNKTVVFRSQINATIPTDYSKVMGAGVKFITIRPVAAAAVRATIDYIWVENEGDYGRFK